MVENEETANYMLRRIKVETEQLLFDMLRGINVLKMKKKLTN